LFDSPEAYQKAYQIFRYSEGFFGITFSFCNLMVYLVEAAAQLLGNKQLVAIINQKVL